MPTPSCHCRKIWGSSLFRFDLTGLLEWDGSVDVETCDPQTGKITGKHYNAAGVYDSDIEGTCYTSSPEIAFTREARINGVTYIISYSGDIVQIPVPGFFLIVRGRFSRVPKITGAAVADDGDWTAQTPVTLATESWYRKE